MREGGETNEGGREEEGKEVLKPQKLIPAEETHEIG